MEASILERLLKLEKGFMDNKDQLQILESIISSLRTDVTTILSWVSDSFGLELSQNTLRSDAANMANKKSTNISILPRPQFSKRFRSFKRDDSIENETSIGPGQEYICSKDDLKLSTQLGKDLATVNDTDLDYDEGQPYVRATTRSITKELTKDHTPITLPENRLYVLEHKGGSLANHTEAVSEDINAIPNPSMLSQTEKVPKGTPMICDVCGKVLKGAGSLRCHKQIHSNQRPYKCLLCPNKAFKMKHHLDFHILTHKGDKKWTCKFCSKGFIVQRDLLRHERTHTGERPFGCNLCPKSFNVKQHLTLHIRTHTGERPYKCPICEKTFTQANSLRIHKKIHAKVLERVETGTRTGEENKGPK